MMWDKMLRLADAHPWAYAACWIVGIAIGTSLARRAVRWVNDGGRNG
jgi:hypothetical protein